MLKASEVWPDGDGPANPTAADVAAVMAADSKHNVLDEWCLLPYVVVDVYGLSDGGNLGRPWQ